MILMVHGYGLSGSGSNLWTRAVVGALCRQGENVHLLCQESRPEAYGFVGSAYEYDAQGSPSTLFERRVDTPGRCTVHRVALELLPVYVQPAAGATALRCILDMPDEEIDEYLRRNERALDAILAEHDIAAVHVNHAVLMSVAVMHACRRWGHPFAVMPHGSAIEYVVRRDERMLRMAREVMAAADRILILNDEMRRRIDEVFPDVPDAHAKMVHVPVGVDIDSFRAVPRERRPENIEHLKRRLQSVERGMTHAQKSLLAQAVHPDLTREEVLDVIARANDYRHRKPDEGIENALDSVDWSSARVVAYVGRLLGHKGTHALLAAFPLILDAHPKATLLLAGSGPQREALELMAHALAANHQGLVDRFADWGTALEGEAGEPYAELTAFFGGLTGAERSRYYEAAARMREEGRVVFTGYLEHSELSLLFPCADAGVFPSIVKEASPLVVPEAIASGVVPIGMDQAGMAASLDHAEQSLPASLRPHIRIRPQPEHVVRDIAACVSAVLRDERDLSVELHAYAVKHYDWQNIARRMVSDMEAIPQKTG